MLNETQKAIADFDTLVLKYPNSSYVVKSYLQLGLLHYGIDENEKALKAYVITSYSIHYTKLYDYTFICL